MYDPETAAFRSGESMATARKYHTATLLSDGRVLIVGGYDGTDYLASAELYRPWVFGWTPEASNGQGQAPASGRYGAR